MTPRKSRAWASFLRAGRVPSPQSQPTDLVDLHSHLLPGIDDGPASLDETVAVLQAAHAAGVRRMVATPHMFLEPWNHRDPERIREAFASTVEGLRQRASSDPTCSFLDQMTIELGAENYASPELLSAIDRGRALTLNRSRYLLIEFSPPLPAPTILEVVRRIHDGGHVAVVAHVERYGALQDRSEHLDRLRDLGAILQINAQSLTQRRSEQLRRHCIELLRSGIAQVVASDVHGPAMGRAHLDAAWAALYDELPADLLRACLSENARRILDDEILLPDGT